VGPAPMGPCLPSRAEAPPAVRGEGDVAAGEDRLPARP